jgi:hypothetical protein
VIVDIFSLSLAVFVASYEVKIFIRDQITLYMYDYL